MKNSESANKYFEQGKTYFQKGLLDDAATSFQQAILLESNRALLHYYLGLIFQKQKKNLKCLDCFHKAIEIQPDRGHFYYSLANIWLQHNHFYAAINSYKKAIELGYQNYCCYFYFGTTLEKIGKLEAAIAAYEKTIKLKPDFEIAYHKLGIVLAKSGLIDEAIAAQQKVIELNANFEQAYQSLLEALVEKIALQQEKQQLNFNLVPAYITLGESLIAITKKTNLEPQQNHENFNYKFSQFCHIFGQALAKLREKKPIAYSDLRETQEPKKLFFDKTISLGSFCMPAHQIRKHLKQKEAYIFDWWVTPHQSLLKLVAEDFYKLFNIESLQLVKASKNNIYLVGDRYYGHRYDHDFPRYDKNNPEMLKYAGESVLENWKLYLPQAIEKCEFLLQRWRKTLSNNRRILFVRVEYKWNPQKAIELRNLFLKNYPQIAPHFLLVGEAESPYDLREDWKLEKITTFHLPPPNYLNPPIPLPMGQIPPIDSGAEAWQQIFHQLNSVNSEEELPSHVLAEPVKIAGDRFFDRKTILMDANLQGEGWFAAEFYRESWVRWMKETGTIVTEIPVAKPLEIQVEGLLATNKDFVEGMTVKVGDRPVENGTIKRESDRSWRFKGEIPAGAIDPDKPCVISIESPGVKELSPKDSRTASLLVTQVILTALK